MTNFQAQPPSRFAVTPERLVLALPALAGGLLAAGLALAWLLPAWQRNGALEQQRQLLKSQGEALAANRARLGRSREGCSRLRPISASCCRSWRAPISSTPCSRNWRWKQLPLASLLRAMSPRRPRCQRPSPSAAKPKATRLPQRSLLVDGELVKREQLVMASGAFPQLLVFLRRIESLAFGGARDLNLSTRPLQETARIRLPTVLKFNLSVYSRAPKEDQAPSTSGRKEPAA